MTEPNPDDLKEVSYTKEETYAGTQDDEGYICFTWKGKQYDVAVDVHYSWNDRNHEDDKWVEIVDKKPNDISDEDWEYICEEIKTEVR